MAERTDLSTDYRRLAARLVWLVLAIISLGWFAVNVPAFYRQVAAVSDAPAWYPAVTAGLDVLFVGLCTAVALVIFSRKPDNRMAWLTSLVLILWGINNGLIIQTKDALLGDTSLLTGPLASLELLTLMGYMGWMLFFWSEEHAREYRADVDQPGGIYLTLEQMGYATPISQGALFAFA